MYETIKELHIEIEQRIQQITSNRYGSMPPQFYDMMLNRTAIKYIQSKSNRKTNYKGEGLEDSMKRVEDFQSLKRETEWIPVIKDENDSERGFVLLPSNYLKFITSTSKLQFEKNISKTIKTETDDDFKNTYYIVSESLSKQEIADSIRSVTDLVDMVINDEEESSIYNEINLLFEKFSTSVDLPKYVIEYIHDLFNVKLEPNINVYYEFFNNRYYKDRIIISSNSRFVDHPDLSNYTDKCFVANTKNIAESEETPNYIIYPKQIYSENDLIASENIRAALNNPYSKKNRHLNPITELINDKLYVYQGQDFCVSEMKITYIKKPRLFSSDLDQMSDMTITPEFVDMVVSDILLILKDNTFNLVKQQTNIE